MNNTALFYYYYPNKRPISSQDSRHLAASGSGERRTLHRETCRARRALRELLSASPQLSSPSSVRQPNPPGPGKLSSSIR